MQSAGRGGTRGVATWERDCTAHCSTAPLRRHPAAPPGRLLHRQWLRDWDSLTLPLTKLLLRPPAAEQRRALAARPKTFQWALSVVLDVLGEMLLTPRTFTAPLSNPPTFTSVGA